MERQSLMYSSPSYLLPGESTDRSHMGDSRLNKNTPSAEFISFESSSSFKSYTAAKYENKSSNPNTILSSTELPVKKESETKSGDMESRPVSKKKAAAMSKYVPFLPPVDEEKAAQPSYIELQQYLESLVDNQGYLTFLPCAKAGISVIGSGLCAKIQECYRYGNGNSALLTITPSSNQNAFGGLVMSVFSNELCTGLATTTTLSHQIPYGDCSTSWISYTYSRSVPKLCSKPSVDNIVKLHIYFTNSDLLHSFSRHNDVNDCNALYYVLAASMLFLFMLVFKVGVLPNFNIKRAFCERDERYVLKSKLSDRELIKTKNSAGATVDVVDNEKFIRVARSFDGDEDFENV